MACPGCCHPFVANKNQWVSNWFVSILSFTFSCSLVFQCYCFPVRADCFICKWHSESEVTVQCGVCLYSASLLYGRQLLTWIDWCFSFSSWFTGICRCSWVFLATTCVASIGDGTFSIDLHSRLLCARQVGLNVLIPSLPPFTLQFLVNGTHRSEDSFCKNFILLSWRTFRRNHGTWELGGMVASI